MKGSEET